MTQKVSFLIGVYRRILRLRYYVSVLGFYPLRISLLSNVPRYLKELSQYKSRGGFISNYFPVLSENIGLAGTAKGHYFHQDLLVSQYIYARNPARHVDVGSRIDGFVAHVASFRKIEIVDIRPFSPSEHPNIVNKQADLMNVMDLEKTDSLSCLHAIEHFGLGRYGDPINPDGYLVGFQNLVSMLLPGGILYISFPIGSKNEVHFNAHRVFHPTDIFSWGISNLDLLSFDYVDDLGNLHHNHDLARNVPLLTYGCGIYTFLKKI